MCSNQLFVAPKLVDTITKFRRTYVVHPGSSWYITRGAGVIQFNLRVPRNNCPDMPGHLLHLLHLLSQLSDPDAALTCKGAGHEKPWKSAKALNFMN